MKREHYPIVECGKTVMDKLTGHAIDTFHSECNCGWVGPTRSRFDDAKIDGEYHADDNTVSHHGKT